MLGTTGKGSRVKVSVIPVLIFIIFSLFSCRQNNKDNQNTPNPLFLDPATQDFSENPAMLDRIRSGPHGYFRSINIPFSREICNQFADISTTDISLNLHGDAHIEQYAVTDLGRGLTDFDDSSTGPGILDLMRFGVSLRLTCLENKWEDKADQAFDAFLSGYRTALNDPTIVAPEPVVVGRIKSTFKVDRSTYFEWINSIIEPIEKSEADSLIRAMLPYKKTMLAEKPELNNEFFDIVQVGRHRLGIGSALDIKYLVQINGNTNDPKDDVVLEFKEVRDLSDIPCINTGKKIDPFRILLGQARISYQPFKYLGYFHFYGRTFWVHSWVDNYKEVNIKKSFQNIKELNEVAYDVGVQLGLGHVKQIAEPLGLQLRREQLLMLELHGEKIKLACKEYADLTVKAWKRFCENPA